MTPGRYVERVRLEAARRHLEDTAAGVEQAARACGYRTTEAMRRAFNEALGVSPAEYRRRFRPIPQEHHADRHRAVTDETGTLHPPLTARPARRWMPGSSAPARPGTPEATPVTFRL
jgi:hypothetical protein